MIYLLICYSQGAMAEQEPLGVFVLGANKLPTAAFVREAGSLSAIHSANAWETLTNQRSNASGPLQRFTAIDCAPSDGILQQWGSPTATHLLHHHLRHRLARVRNNLTQCRISLPKRENVPPTQISPTRHQKRYREPTAPRKLPRYVVPLRKSSLVTSAG
jgi:hypothetical protein